MRLTRRRCACPSSNARRAPILERRAVHEPDTITLASKTSETSTSAAIRPTSHARAQHWPASGTSRERGTKVLYGRARWLWQNVAMDRKVISRDLARATLAILFIVGMIVASFWILRPFLPAVIWATMIVIATWPLMLRVQSALWGRRGLAVAVMTVVLLLGLIVPLALALSTIVAHSEDIASGVQRLATWSAPPPPASLARPPPPRAR